MAGVALSQTWNADKGKSVRRNYDGSHAEGCGDDRHFMIGVGDQKDRPNRDIYRSYVHFPFSWTGVKNLIKAELSIVTDDDATHFEIGSNPEVWVHRLTKAFSDGNNGENHWDSAEYENPSKEQTVKYVLPLNYNVTPPRPYDDQRVYIDVTYLLQEIAPTSVTFPNGKSGLGHTTKNFGFMLRAPDKEAVESRRMIFGSDKASNTTFRPKITFTYDPVNRVPEAPTLSAPPVTGTVTFNDFFEGDHIDLDGDPMKARYIEVREKVGGKSAWKQPAISQAAGSEESLTGHFSVPLAAAVASLKSGVAYEWRAATQDSLGLPKAWDATAKFSGWRALTITSSAPTIVATNNGTIKKMADARFGGVYSDPEKDPLSAFEIEMRPGAAQTAANFDDRASVVWATGETSATADEVNHKDAAGVLKPTVSRSYAGQALTPGTYTMRIRARDLTGVWSAWSYDDFSLTEVFNPSPTPDDGDNPDDIALLTQVGRLVPVRIALYKVDGANGRGRGALIGYIDDPMDLGGSAYLNSGGEVYFSLPALHPYCQVVEPHQTHYAIERYEGDRYKELPFAGIITDFEADADTMVAFGTDYLGLLQTAVDERFDPNNDRKPANGSGGGGSYYADRSIDYVLKDQLRYHKAAANSPVGFITIGAKITALAERITIHSTYTECLPFITGLIDSHKQGTGREARFYVKPNADYSAWEWYLTDNWGKDRPNIQLEWGGLLNDFRVIALGDFATRVLAVGQKRDEVKVYRATGTGGMPEATFGRRAATRFYPEIVDKNDLQRRANEDANALAKIGKRLALAIRADMLGPFDGYDLGDHVMVDIERGVVKTTAYGSGGYWTILGLEWRYHPDGHSDLTLTVVPKSGKGTPPSDLIPAITPGVPNDWQVGHGVPVSYANPPSPTPPPGGTTFAARGVSINPLTGELPLDTDPTVGANYQDLNTGCIYALDQELYEPPGDPGFNPNPNYGLYSLVSCPAPGNITTVGPVPPTDPAVGDIWIDDSVTPPVSYIWDGTQWVSQTGEAIDKDAPPVPTLVSRPDFIVQADGSVIARIESTMSYPVDPGITDLAEFIVQSTRHPLLTDASKPDWALAQERTVASEDNTGLLPTTSTLAPAVASTHYWVRAAAVDVIGNRSGWSAEESLVTVGDNVGPTQPKNVVTIPGHTSIAIRWTPVQAEDFSRSEVQWRLNGTADWTRVETAASLVVITGLTNDVLYDLRVRAIDTSDNVQHLDGTGAPVKPAPKVTDPTTDELGWVTPTPVAPTAVSGDDIAWDEASIAAIFAGQINADWITAGTLKVGGSGQAAAIEVYDGDGNLVGKWGTEGIEVLDPDNPDYRMVITESSLRIYADASGDPVVSLTPLGIDAASITFGSARGGHNLVANSSFEMGPFIQVATSTAAWDTQAEFNAAGSRQGSDTNLTTGAGGTITMTAVT